MTFWNMTKKHFIEMSRYPISFFAGFIVILLLILMFLYSTTMFTSTDSADTNTIFGYGIYGMVMFLLISSIPMEIGWSIRAEQLRGTLESLYITPANRFLNLVSRNFVIFIFELISIGVVLSVITIFIRQLPINNLLLALYILFMTIIGVFGFSFIIAGCVIKLKQTMHFGFQIIQFFLIIFCAMFFPFKVLPEFIVKYVSMAIPFSYCVDAFRTVLMNVKPELLSLTQEIVVITMFAVIMIIVGILFFKYIDRKIRTDGTLGEY